jgi:hypothetical protein
MMDSVRPGAMICEDISGQTFKGYEIECRFGSCHISSYIGRRPQAAQVSSKVSSARYRYPNPALLAWSFPSAFPALSFPQRKRRFGSGHRSPSRCRGGVLSAISANRLQVGLHPSAFEITFSLTRAVTPAISLAPIRYRTLKPSTQVSAACHHGRRLPLPDIMA